jgi:glucokinase
MSGKKPYVIGIDLGGTKILATLFDRRFRPLAEVKTRSKPQKGERYFMKALEDCFDELLSEGGVKRSEVVGVGVGCPGIIDERRGLVVDSPNLGFMRHFPLARRIQKHTRLPVVIGNDVNVGLFGEQQLGAARGHAHVVGIFIGTGIGGALILNGQLYGGVMGAAGEIGHMQLDPDGPRCGCGKYGCFEALCSRLSIALEAAGLAARQKAPHLFQTVGTDPLEIKSGELAKAIREGDRAILELIKHKAHQIGVVTANVVNLLNPELVVLGGGLIESLGHVIVKEAAAAMTAQAMPALAARVKVIAAKLGDRAIVMGGAKLALDAFSAPTS